MTACKTASGDALWPQFIKAVANEAGPTDRRSDRPPARVASIHGRPGPRSVGYASITIKTSSITTTKARSTVLGQETACVDALTLH